MAIYKYEGKPGQGMTLTKQFASDFSKSRAKKASQGQTLYRYFRCRQCTSVTAVPAGKILPRQDFVECSNCGQQVDAALPKIKPIEG